MKFSLFNLLSMLTMFALAVALITNLRRDRKVEIIGNDIFDTVELLESVAKKSTWTEKSSPPQLLPNAVFAIAERVSRKLNESSDKLGYRWKIADLRFVPLESTVFSEEVGDEWIYLVTLNGTQDPVGFDIPSKRSLAFVVLMDGTAVFSSEYQPKAIVELFDKLGFETTRGMPGKAHPNLSR